MSTIICNKKCVSFHNAYLCGWKSPSFSPNHLAWIELLEIQAWFGSLKIQGYFDLHHSHRRQLLFRIYHRKLQRWCFPRLCLHPQHLFFIIKIKKDYKRARFKFKINKNFQGKISVIAFVLILTSLRVLDVFRFVVINISWNINHNATSLIVY